MPTYLLPKARNLVTQQTVKIQDLNGTRYSHSQRHFAQQAADDLAAKMTASTGDNWVGYVVEYTPSQRLNT